MPNDKVERMGTMWVAPGEGSTWRELITAFGTTPSDPRYNPCKGWLRIANFRGLMDNKTNLKLSGQALQPYDYQRWESGNVE